MRQLKQFGRVIERPFDRSDERRMGSSARASRTPGHVLSPESTQAISGKAEHPVILGERLKFTLFSTGEGVSIEAELVQTDVAPPKAGQSDFTHS
jgi:hypothetical protein